MTPSAAGPSKTRPHKKTRHHPYANKPPRQPIHEDALPGVQKLKSALRQTKRLLAKQSLAADVRVETERRMKALDADLARAEGARKERNFAVKYHKIKFFERQKVVRKINQTKRSLETSEGKETKKLESALDDLRVDLNYILHYPKTKRYVSLFPPAVRQSGAPAVPVAAASDDNDERSKVRALMREQMERGELSTTPEIELGVQGQDSTRSKSSRKAVEAAPSKKSSRMADSVASDDFFGNDDDEGDSQQSEGSEAGSG
ncbi:hypothetical protein PAXRUDRAFT_826065 [Paxillus rubicundulus Ve08.2h10]|uniref:rRNA-processing protein EFG1 n=1 Tax=Paxillus rubicundulus Ve08.2h10 TaxID=930991 RepID=A0A0D0E4X3_9AGAM|nr:hypothetical protein PAXRUDRAFT_826065 [Paxillus rubicundulus Ve08.2h10]